MTVFIVLMETLEENSPSFSKKGENYQSEGMKNGFSTFGHFLVPFEFQTCFVWVLGAMHCL